MFDNQYEEFASANEGELKIAAENILSYCGLEPTENHIKNVVNLMRQHIYKYVDVTNEWIEKKNLKAEEEEKIRKERMGEVKEEIKESTESHKDMLPDDYEPDDNLLFGFGLMQLLLYRMERARTNKPLSLHIRKHNDAFEFSVFVNNTAAIVDDGKVIFKNSDAFNLVNPDSVAKIIDRIFIDS